ncbi:MAG TPA: GtrA family protein [Steroidobacteraceae bacterium]|nr:GtrA family protein [Steroidobacteraceae bacterium]
MKVLLKETLGYTLASAAALAVDAGILFILVHFFAWWYLAAATVSFTVGLFVAYGLSVTVVFKRRRVADRRLEFATFAAIGLLGLVVNAVVIYAGVRYAGLHYMAAKAVAAGFTFAGNFLARRQLLFVRPATA